jgi:hypothetical protein
MAQFSSTHILLAAILSIGVAKSSFPEFLDHSVKEIL